MGGDTCGVYKPRSQFSSAMAEMQRFHRVSKILTLILNKNLIHLFKLRLSFRCDKRI